MAVIFALMRVRKAGISTLRFIVVSLCIAGFLSSSAQKKVLKGTIKDQHSGEQVPFASVSFKKSGIGKLADSSGSFVFRFAACVHTGSMAYCALQRRHAAVYRVFAGR